MTEILLSFLILEDYGYGFSSTGFTNFESDDMNRWQAKFFEVRMAVKQRTLFKCLDVRQRLWHRSNDRKNFISNTKIENSYLFFSVFLFVFQKCQQWIVKVMTVIINLGLTIWMINQINSLLSTFLLLSLKKNYAKIFIFEIFFHVFLKNCKERWIFIQKFLSDFWLVIVSNNQNKLWRKIFLQR